MADVRNPKKRATSEMARLFAMKKDKSERLERHSYCSRLPGEIPFDLNPTSTRSLQNMKRLLISIATVIIGSVVFAPASETGLQATFLGPADITNVIRQASPTAAIDRPLRIIDGGRTNVGIFVVHRPQEADQGCTIEHDTLVNDKTTSIFFVLDGAGTLVTGGKLAKPTALSSDDPDLKLLGSGSRGSGIEGGESHRITKGDVVIIPPGLPHGFSAIEESITYEVVRIDSGKVLPLK